MVFTCMVFDNSWRVFRTFKCSRKCNWSYGYWMIMLRLSNNHANELLWLINWMFYITNIISCISINSLWSSKALVLKIKPCISKNTFFLFHWMFFRIHWYHWVKFLLYTRYNVAAKTNSVYSNELISDQLHPWVF